MTGETAVNGHSQEGHDARFLFGLATGVIFGAGLTMYFAPKIGSEIRKRAAASAKDLVQTASEYCDEVSTRLVDAVEELSSGAHEARDAAADLVARGAHQVARGAHKVERFADAAKTGSRGV